MPTNEYEGIERLKTVADIVNSLKTNYPDAKKFGISIRFEWQETSFYDDGAELCPVVGINIER